MSTYKNKRKKKEEKIKTAYKGPFPLNKNYAIENTRKYMKTEEGGPTVDEFSYQDTTDSIDISDPSPKKKTNKRPRKKHSVIQSWAQKHASEIIVGVIVAIITSFFSIIVYKHSNHLVAHDKDIEYIHEKETDLKEKIQHVESNVDNVKEKVYEIDKRVEIHDLQINKSNKKNK